MVLSTLALVGIIQLILLLIGGIFFLLLHTRFLKKQIRALRGDDTTPDETAPTAAPSETEHSAEASQDSETQSNHDDTAEPETHLPEEVTGEISELRKMLDEKLLLTANMRKLIEALEQNPDSAEEVATQQKSSLLHLEEYIKLSRKEGAAVEDKITHYREQLAKAKKMLVRLKEQHEADIKQRQQAEEKQKEKTTPEPDEAGPDKDAAN